MKIQATDLNPHLVETIKYVSDQVSHAPLNHHNYIRGVVSAAQKPQDMTHTLNMLHELQRLNFLAQAGGFNEAALTAVEKNKHTWTNYQTLPLTTQQFFGLAQKLDEAGDPQQSALVILNDYTRGYGEQVVQTIHTRGQYVGVHFDDEWGKSLAIGQCQNEEAAERFAQAYRKPWNDFDRRITLKSEYESYQFEPFSYQVKFRNVFIRKSKELEKQNKSKPYILTSMPCPQHALLDGVPHAELCHYYYRMCMDDMGVMEEPHQAIINAYNAGSNVVIRNQYGTDLSMSIKGQSAVSSKTARNLPGSEVYGSPELYSAHGVIVSPEHYVHKGQSFSGITMTFENGVITQYDARVGRDVLAAILEADYKSGFAQEQGVPASKGIGELGFGTNRYPVPFQSCLNMMGEKVDVHLGIGRAYTDTFYGASVDNGNRGSGPHKDMVMAIRNKKGGDVIVDGVYWIQDGQYVLPGTEILNQKLKIKGLSL
jgi:aminopeptidase